MRGIQELPHLRRLDLSACRKLSPAFVKAALAASDSVAARSPGGTICRPLDLQQQRSLQDLMLEKKNRLCYPVCSSLELQVGPMTPVSCALCIPRPGTAQKENLVPDRSLQHRLYRLAFDAETTRLCMGSKVCD